jgi:uncharacterized membrane protein
VLVIIALLLCGLAYALVRLRRERAAHKAEVVSLAGTVLTERDRKMAAFHVRRFSDAVEQCEKPERREELQNNLRYWQAVMAAEEVRP